MTRHSLSTLRYRLIPGPIRLEPLRVLEARTISWRGRHVTFTILGASHAVSLTGDSAQLTELLTCAPPCDPVASLAEACADVEGSLTLRTETLTCRVLLSPFQLAKQDDNLSGHYAPEDRLALAYPSLRGEVTPMTRIGWRFEGARLIVETVHTYPEEGRGVRTETVFEARREGGR